MLPRFLSGLAQDLHIKGLTLKVAVRYLFI